MKTLCEEFIRKELKTTGTEAWDRIQPGHDAIIEASAGTGKTYTLERIVLKLLFTGTVESVKNILLVTFTDKAAGELKDRIRKILSAAGMLPPDFGDASICTIHSFCRNLLREFAFESRAPMQTEVGGDEKGLIHRAVFETLTGNEFQSAFGSVFASLMRISSLGSADDLLASAEKMLKRWLGGHGSEMFSLESDRNRARENFRLASDDVLRAKGNLSFREWALSGVTLHGADAKKANPFYEWLSANFQILANPDHPQWLDVVSTYSQGGPSSRNPRITGEGAGKHLFDRNPILGKLDESLSGIYGVLKRTLVESLAKRSFPAFEKMKAESSAMTFDDMVQQASRIVAEEADKERNGVESPFLRTIRKKYRVALVDEFQDTDAAQWNIFENVFSAVRNRYDESAGDVPAPKRGFLVIVGDPKQAIYSFRGADVGTYLAARRTIVANGSEPIRLSTTYRSAPRLVDAFNEMFKTGGGWFDGMSEGSGGEGISYEPVSVPRDHGKFRGLEDGTGREAVTLLESLPGRFPNPAAANVPYGNAKICLPEFMRNAAREMKRLRGLDPAYAVREGDCRVAHRYLYGDMCVLVRGNDQALVVKRIFREEGIPYSQYKEQGLYETVEAESLLAVFDYLAAPGRPGRLAALLLTPLFGVAPGLLENRLARGDASFSGLSDRWQEWVRARKWSRLFESILDDTELAHPTAENAEYDARWAATRQILDRLLREKGHSAETIEDFSDTLRGWRTAGRRFQEEGPLRRQESESDRVQILTMHTSKGLEFKAVFIAYGFSEVAPLADPAEREAALREEKRLLYVALTRAEQKLYLPWSQWAPHERIGTKSSGPENGIGSVGSALLMKTGSDAFLGRAICRYFADEPEKHVVSVPEEEAIVSPGGADGEKSVSTVDEFRVGHLWHLHHQWDSFTSLSSRSTKPPVTVERRGKNEFSDEPESREKSPTCLPRDNVSGDVFHEIMETLCGNDDTEKSPGFVSVGAMQRADLEAAFESKTANAFVSVVRAALARNALKNRTTANGDSTEKTLARMVWNALWTELSVGGRSFRLKDIASRDRRAEQEFVIDEESLFGEDRPLLGSRKRNGSINGKIDLLVRPDGKDGPVYVIDWKTNSLSGYDSESVREAMDAAGYHLQHRLYSLAVRRWLGEGRPNGVFYLFVRGGEQTGPSGVFAEELTEASIAECRRTVLAALSNVAEEK